MQSQATVCDEWLMFSNFLVWWKKNYIDGWNLNNSILSDSGLCSPLTCLYVPQWLHGFLRENRKGGNGRMIGVGVSSSGKFTASCCPPLSGKAKYIGSFDAEIDAHIAWRKRKLEHAMDLKPDMDSIDRRIYPRVVDRINSMR